MNVLIRTFVSVPPRIVDQIKMGRLLLRDQRWIIPMITVVLNIILTSQHATRNRFNPTRSLQATIQPASDVEVLKGRNPSTPLKSRAKVKSPGRTICSTGILEFGRQTRVGPLR